MRDAATERALRKQLLLMRAATERAEMAEAWGAARQAVTFPKMAVSGLALFKGIPLALSLLKRLPLIKPVLLLALSGARRPLLKYALVAAATGLLAWKGYQWFIRRHDELSEQGDEAEGPGG
ncbi:MAG TPA: hypothetical protein VE934_05410 [Polaromonas sp.]|uniref:hypothetical protein n=1 Tax=Polaromonas sp. TaxID=1869339 RepID=UPI002D334C1D|nr:hypothetical protein [Polaromonas sp.]HYW56373.1 hypothetical protein [Polaromonas sp.]